MRHLILEGEPGGLPVTPGPAGPVGESLAEYVDHSLDHDDLSTALPHPQAYREYCAARRKALAARNSGPAARARRLWTRWVARSRIVATSRISTLWPGSRIRRASNCRRAARNNTGEATSPAQACRYTQAVTANRPGWAAKSRYP